ncbi:MAG: hypothetical protein ACRC5H_01425 [Treponemataceae bacterium]
MSTTHAIKQILCLFMVIIFGFLGFTQHADQEKSSTLIDETSFILGGENVAGITQTTET